MVHAEAQTSHQECYLLKVTSLNNKCRAKSYKWRTDQVKFKNQETIWNHIDEFQKTSMKM